MRRYIILAAAASVLGIAAIAESGGGAPPGPLHQLALARPQRAISPRLSIDTEYRPCATLPPPDGGTVPVEACGTGDEAPPNLLAFRQMGESAAPDSLQASALAAVIWWDSAGASLDEAIADLETARLLTLDDIALLVDLSAAHLVRARRTQNPSDLLRAADFASEALALEPANLAALFNHALALQAWGLDAQAILAWDAYLAVDSTSAWADEARARRRALRTHTAAPLEPGPGAPEAVSHAFAAQYPQEARELGWNEVLAEWGTAVESGDAVRAGWFLDLAEGLGRALEQRGRDASLADAVRAIGAASDDAAATAVLARAHRLYAEGHADFVALEHDSALAALDSVLDARPASPVLLQWTTLIRAGVLAYHHRRDEAILELRALLPRIDAGRNSALAGRTHLMLGTLLFRAKHHQDARDQLHTAKLQLGRAGDTELMGNALSTESETAYEQGDTVVAYQSMHRAQQILRSYRDSRWLHNHLIVTARCAMLDGLRQSALEIYDEDVPLALRLQVPVLGAEALHARARIRSMKGDTGSAAEDLDNAAVLAETVNDSTARNWTRALVQSGRSGTNAAAAIDSAVTYFTNAKNSLWLVPALVHRANVRLEAGNVDGAAADLGAVTSNIRQLSQRDGNLLLRGAVIEQARSLFNRLVMLNVRLQRDEEALRTLERGRVSFESTDGRAPSANTGRLMAPAGQVALEYALIGDTLLTWTVKADTVRLHRQTIDRDTFLLTVAQAGTALESPARGADPRPALRRLYEVLIRPVRNELGGRETPLVILADGEIAGVPFEALLAGENDEYLIKDHPLRFATTLADAARPAIHRPAGTALLVADPAFERSRYSTLFRLPGAREEVDSIRRLYPHAVRLDSTAATREALLAAARSASIIHYAGHAVFDDARPERSFLVLAGEGDAGRLTADSVVALDLRGVRLVVLSACRTLRSRGGRSGGFAGLSGALLAAGADGVVGSLWKANDALTRPLMVWFHEEYARTPHDPAGALRRAQLRMLGSHDPALRSPAAWAGFRYAGR